MARERKFQGANWPGSYWPIRSGERIGPGAKRLGTKSHTGFQFVPTSMTLNDLERRNSSYFAFFHGIREIFRPIISQWLKLDL